MCCCNYIIERIEMLHIKKADLKSAFLCQMISVNLDFSNQPLQRSVFNNENICINFSFSYIYHRCESFIKKYSFKNDCAFNLNVVF
jgi:hypothetical protein